MSPIGLRSNIVATRSEPDCTWYHGTWQYLRALGVSKTAGGHATFLTDSLRSLVAGGDVRRVLISGSADDAMTLIALEAFRDATVRPELTLIDLCETPLALSRWSAERLGGTVATHRTDILDLCGRLAIRRRDVEQFPLVLRAGGAAAIVCALGVAVCGPAGSCC